MNAIEDETPRTAAGAPSGGDVEGADVRTSIESISSPPFPPVTNPWRGLLTLALGLTLCVLAVAESTGEASAPTWFLGFSIPVLTEWVGEWLVYWRKMGVV